jgi:hypothetical protein
MPDPCSELLSTHLLSYSPDALFIRPKRARRFTAWMLRLKAPQKLLPLAAKRLSLAARDARGGGANRGVATLTPVETVLELRAAE